MSPEDFGLGSDFDEALAEATGDGGKKEKQDGGGGGGESASLTGDDNKVQRTDFSKLKMILDIPLKVSVELGRTKMLVNDLLQLGQGSVIELDKIAGEPMEILINDKLVAMGEVVVVNEKFGVRLDRRRQPVRSRRPRAFGEGWHETCSCSHPSFDRSLAAPRRLVRRRCAARHGGRRPSRRRRAPRPNCRPRDAGQPSTARPTKSCRAVTIRLDKKLRPGRAPRSRCRTTAPSSSWSLPGTLVPEPGKFYDGDNPWLPKVAVYPADAERRGRPAVHQPRRQPGEAGIDRRSPRQPHRRRRRQRQACAST